jgi:hypothetical protein
MTTSALGPRQGGWRRPVAVVADLSDLRCPLTGVVRLPLRVFTGPAKDPLLGSIWPTRRSALSYTRSC